MPRTETATCQDCGWQGPVEDTKELRNVWDRVSPGDVMPAGECPEEGCGGAAMLDDARHDADDLRPAMVALMLGLDRLHESIGKGERHARRHPGGGRIRAPAASAARATVAQSLRSLRPHHSRTPPGHSFRPRWLPCARVTQRRRPPAPFAVATSRPLSAGSKAAPSSTLICPVSRPRRTFSTSAPSSSRRPVKRAPALRRRRRHECLPCGPGPATRASTMGTSARKSSAHCGCRGSSQASRFQRAAFRSASVCRRKACGGASRTVGPAPARQSAT